MTSSLAVPSTDVIVVGGGPGGSTTGSLLAKAGVSVLVLERETFPRFHIGESMLPQSFKVWERLGVVDELRERYMPKYGARFLDCKTGSEKTYEFGDAFDTSVSHSFQVLRSDFDKLLLDHAEALGAEVRYRWEVTAPLLEGRTIVGVKARDPEGAMHDIRARVVVDATGRDALLAGRLGAKSKLPSLDKTAFFSHWEGVLRQSGRNEGHIDIIVFEQGWMWNIPFRGDGSSSAPGVTPLNSFGFVCSPEWVKQRRPDESIDAFYDRTLASASWANKLLAKATKRAPARAIADYSYRVDAYAGNGWVMVGDASGFIDPLFSTGAHLAFMSGELAADEITAALSAGRAFTAGLWNDYERKVRAAAELFAGAVQAFYAGDLVDSIFVETQRAVLRKTITSMLAGDVSGEDLAWRRFLRARYPVRLTSST